MTEYLVVLERASGNWSAYSPDVLGCIAAADTLEETRLMFQDALQGHLDWMRADGDPIPVPCAETDSLTLALPGLPPRRYLAILQPTPLGDWSVFAADVPDLVLEFTTRDHALRLLGVALKSHLEALVENGEAVPEPTTQAAHVAVHLADLSIAA